MSPADGVLLFWSLPVIVMDMHSRRVRWWWSAAGFLAAGILRTQSWFSMGFDQVEMLLIIAAAVGSWRLWRAGIWGGADAKTAMALTIFVPDLYISLFAGGFVLATAGAALFWQRRYMPGTTQREGRKRSAGGEYPMAAMLCLSVLLFAALWKKSLF